MVANISSIIHDKNVQKLKKSFWVDGPKKVEQDLIGGFSALNDQKPGKQQVVPFHAIVTSGFIKMPIHFIIDQV